MLTNVSGTFTNARNTGFFAFPFSSAGSRIIEYKTGFLFMIFLTQSALRSYHVCRERAHETSSRAIPGAHAGRIERRTTDPLARSVH